MRACVSERVSASVPRNFIYGNPGAEKKSFSNTTPYGERGGGVQQGAPARSPSMGICERRKGGVSEATPFVGGVRQ